MENIRVLSKITFHLHQDGCTHEGFDPTSASRPTYVLYVATSCLCAWNPEFLDSANLAWNQAEGSEKRAVLMCLELLFASQAVAGLGCCLPSACKEGGVHILGALGIQEPPPLFQPGWPFLWGFNGLEPFRYS